MGVMERGGCSQECPLQQERQAKFQEHHKDEGGGGGGGGGAGGQMRGWGCILVYKLLKVSVCTNV